MFGFNYILGGVCVVFVSYHLIGRCIRGQVCSCDVFSDWLRVVVGGLFCIWGVMLVSSDVIQK